tara:strand:- start:1024 stop:1467 length:444 start_codon:yes stop_codon:yes gene_type:complete
MYEGNHIKPCTSQLALEVGENLRPDDKREVEDVLGLYGPVGVLASYYNSQHRIYFHGPNGKAAGVAGVTHDNRIWMLCTPVIEETPHIFVREAKRWLDSLPHTYVYNHADMRNEVHIKLLKFLGFKFLRYYVINGVPLIEFMKLCVP